MALSTVTLTWDLTDFLQVNIPEQCVLYITPSFLLADTTDHIIIPALTRSVTFTGGTGTLAGIVANDNAALAPTGSTYKISVFDPSANKNLVEDFNVAINHANGATQDLSYLYSNQSFSGPSFFQYLASSNNLSELSNTATARTNLGLGPWATAGLSSVQASLSPQFLSAGTVYSASVNDLALADCTTGVTVVNLPSAPANGSTVTVKLLKQNTPAGSVGLYYTTVNTQGIDKFETSTGGTAATLFLLGEAATWQYNTANHVWVRQWGVLPWSKVQANMPAVLNVISFGADPTGTADSTAAIQAAINTATGSAAPATNVRTPTLPVYIPPGTYKITSDLNIQSVSGFRLIGAGIAQTLIKASGTGFTQAVIFIDGSADGLFEGFALQGDGTEKNGASTLPNGIRLDWTTAASRSTTGNCFRDIRVRNLKATTLLSLEGNGSRQLDGTVMHNVVVTGGQTPGSWSNSGSWQNGFLFGDGTYGNNYDHVLTGCSAALCYTGMNVNASSIALYGSQPAGNAQDFSIMAGAQCTISNVQSQQCGTFLVTPSQFTAIPVSFNDLSITTTVGSLSNNLMMSLNGGVWHFKNVALSNVIVGVSYVQATINASGTSAARPVTATFDNLTVNGGLTSSFGTLSHANITVRNFANFNPATGNYAAPGAGEYAAVYDGTWSSVARKLRPSGDTSGAADPVAVNAALTAYGTVELDNGTWYGNATVNVGLGQVVKATGGLNKTVWNSVVATAIPAFKTVNAGAYSGALSAEVSGFTIDGTGAAAGAIGIQGGDVVRLKHDLVISGFSGAGSIGAYLLNAIYWTEQGEFKYYINNCTNGVKCDASGGTNSFDRTRFDVTFNQTVNQQGFIVAGGVNLLECEQRLVGNWAGSAASTGTVLSLTGSNSKILTTKMFIGIEIDGGTVGPQTINFAGASNFIQDCYGMLEFYGSSWQASNNNFNMSFRGTILGDDTLLVKPKGGQSDTSVNSGWPTGITGTVSWRLGWENALVFVSFNITVTAVALTAGEVLLSGLTGKLRSSSSKKFAVDCNGTPNFLQIDSSGNLKSVYAIGSGTYTIEGTGVYSNAL